MSEKKCPCCGASIDLNAAECKYCGEAVNVQVPQYTAPQAPQTPQYQAPKMYTPNGVPTTNKSKTTAGVLGILLGGLGVHKFYLGKIGQGILYLVFCWTYIPAIAGVVEGIIYLTSTDENFYNKYVKK